MKVNFENIYEHIGYLFYALAGGKDELSTDQLVKVTDLIEQAWKPTSNGDPDLQLRLVKCIHEGVSYAAENEMSAEHAFSSFHTYYQLHGLSFSKALKEKIMVSAAVILKEFSGSRSNGFIGVELERLMGVKPAVM